MGWMGRVGVAILLLVVVLGGAYWYLIADGAVDETSDYKADIAGWRALISGDMAALPTALRVEIVGREPAVDRPVGLAHAVAVPGTLVESLHLARRPPS